MENSVETKLQEMQILEQNLQGVLHQKQAFQMELYETESALVELEKSEEEVFKVIGQLMIKSDKSKVEEELENKKKILSLRIGTIEKQEKSIADKLEKMREEIVSTMKK